MVTKITLAILGMARKMALTTKRSPGYLRTTRNGFKARNARKERKALTALAPVMDNDKKEIMTMMQSNTFQPSRKYAPGKWGCQQRERESVSL